MIAALEVEYVESAECNEFKRAISLSERSRDAGSGLSANKRRKFSPRTFKGVPVSYNLSCLT